MHRSLIVTADDFGLSHEVNAAVVQAHRDGILTAASLMVAGSADEAAAIAHDHPNLDVGLHLTVCRGSSVLPPDRLRGIADASGHFPKNPVAAGRVIFFSARCAGLCAMNCGRKLTCICS